jgi:hypothetical protein
MRSTAELGAMRKIGDGVIGLAAPRSHSHLWRFGPNSYRRAMEGFAESPCPLPDLAAAEVGGDLWLALRQYKEE